jgi:hypothetical protein
MKSAPQERPDPCRRGFRGYKRLHSLAAIVRDYIRRHRNKANCELEYFRNLSTLSAAIREAGLARYPDGQRFKRYAHQRRLSPEALKMATKRLRAANLRGARSFDELITRVSAAVQPVHGIGELYVYDTTLRLGGHLGFLPRKVYLHAGRGRELKHLVSITAPVSCRGTSCPSSFGNSNLTSLRTFCASTKIGLRVSMAYNNRLETDLRPARCARWSCPFSLIR